MPVKKRGRPKGSKNKPKPPVVPVTAELAAPALKKRGRPMGSKNKPKQPILPTRANTAPKPPVTRASNQVLRVFKLHLLAGCDVVSELAAYASRKDMLVSVYVAKGTVADVTPDIDDVSMDGPFEVERLSGVVLPSLASPAPLSVQLSCDLWEIHRALFGPAPEVSLKFARDQEDIQTGVPVKITVNDGLALDAEIGVSSTTKLRKSIDGPYTT